MLLLLGALLVEMASGDSFLDFNIIELITIILVGVGGAITILGSSWAYCRKKWGRFALRWLDPCADFGRDPDRPTRVLRLSPAECVARFSLRPDVAISHVTAISFSALENTWYPLRLWMGARGDFVKPTKIVATRIRKHIAGNAWEAWHDIPRPKVGEWCARWDGPILFQRGSREVFEVVYQINESLAGWDGFIGVEVLYVASGNRHQAYVDSKGFVSSLNKCTPLTFKLRRINTIRTSQSTPGTVVSAA